MQTSTPEKLLEAGKKLFEQHDKAEVAAYLLFLDASNKSEIFAPARAREVSRRHRLQPDSALASVASHRSHRSQ